MTSDALRERTLEFAVAIIEFVKGLPRTLAGQTVGEQLARCGTSVGSNYRAACRAQSRNDFIAKLALVEQEADETLYWLEVTAHVKLSTAGQVTPLAREGGEILAMTVASIRTAKANRRATSRQSN